MNGSNEIDWLKNLRNQASRDLETYGFPTLKTEDWKYTRVYDLLKIEFKTPETLQALPEIDFQKFIFTEGAVIVFLDGQFVSQWSRVDHSSIKINSFSEALLQENDLLKQYLGKYAKTNTVGFIALNAAMMQEGFVIEVLKDIRVSQPIQCLFISSGKTAHVAHIRNLLVLQENSQASLIESYVSLEPQAAYFTNAVTEMVLQSGVRLDYYKQQQESLGAFHIHSLYTHQEKDSQFNGFNIDLGAKLGRNWLQNNLAGVHAQCDLSGLYFTSDQQHIDNHTRVEHQVPNTISREYYKGVLADKSRAVFNGQVFIKKDAQKSDAQQRNANLLLSSTAEIDTKPQLEIYADDVKCAHGATISDVSDESLFYLRARGLSENEAKAILLQGFMNEIVDKIKIEPLQQSLKKNLSYVFKQF